MGHLNYYYNMFYISQQISSYEAVPAHKINRFPYIF